MINTVVLTGRLTRDPELKYTQSGVAICRFTMAVNRSFTNASGEREADFPNIITFRKQAENVANFLRKGSLAGVEGRIQTSSFEGKDGKRVFMTEVVANSVQFLESKNANNGNGGQANGNSQQGNATNNQTTNTGSYNMNNDPFGSGGQVDITDDDLPF